MDNIEEMVKAMPSWLLDRIDDWSKLDADTLARYVDDMYLEMGKMARNEQVPAEHFITEYRVCGAIMRWKKAQDMARERQAQMNALIASEVERLRSV